MCKEADIIAACKRYLVMAQQQGLLAFRRINVSPVIRNDRFGRKVFSKNPEMAGLSDFIVWVKGGRTVCFECKTKRGKLSDAQEAFYQELLHVGHVFHIIRSLDEMIFWLDHYGATHFSNRRQT